MCRNLLSFDNNFVEFRKENREDRVMNEINKSQRGEETVVGNE
jgi:hypothetical protein